MDYASCRSLPAMFFGTARQRADRPFLWAKRDCLYRPRSWGEAESAVTRLARALIAHGIQPGDRVALVSVSVNPWADTSRNVALDRRKWRLDPSWRWAVGSYRELSAVWRAYHIGVQIQRKTLAGVTVREVAHTEGAYIIDREGNERALFLFPYQAGDVVRALKDVASS